MDIVLVTPRYPKEKPHDMLGIAVIRQALKEANINVRTYALDQFNESKLRRPTIVGYSAYYQTLDNTLNSATKLDKKHFVVVGGQGIYHNETNKTLLDSGVINALNYGHATPFIELAKRRNESNLEKVAKEEGLITQEQQSVKKGKFPELKTFPIASSQRRGKDKVIVMPSMQRCPNNCDYCVESLFKTPRYVLDKYIESLKEYQKKKKITKINFNNPMFDEKTWEDAEKVLKVIKGKPETSFYVDSQQILNDFDKTKEMLDYFNANAYIGLNAINNKSAAYVGRNIEGVPRTTVEEEKVAILEMIIKRKLSRKETYTISLLTSRADKKKSIEEILEFTSALTQISLLANKKISLQLLKTGPFPETKFYDRAIKDFKRNETPSNITSAYNTDAYAFSNRSIEFFRLSDNGIFLAGDGRPFFLFAGLQEMINAYDFVFEGEMKRNICEEYPFENITGPETKKQMGLIAKRSREYIMKKHIDKVF